MIPICSVAFRENERKGRLMLVLLMLAQEIAGKLCGFAGPAKLQQTIGGPERRAPLQLTVRQRGPLWVIYPWSDQPNLQNEVYYSRSIWQLKALEVRPN